MPRASWRRCEFANLGEREGGTAWARVPLSRRVSRCSSSPRSTRKVERGTFHSGGSTRTCLGFGSARAKPSPNPGLAPGRLDAHAKPTPNPDLPLGRRDAHLARRASTRRWRRAPEVGPGWAGLPQGGPAPGESARGTAGLVLQRRRGGLGAERGGEKVAARRWRRAPRDARRDERRSREAAEIAGRSRRAPRDARRGAGWRARAAPSCGGRSSQALPAVALPSGDHGRSREITGEHGRSARPCSRWRFRREITRGHGRSGACSWSSCVGDHERSRGDHGEITGRYGEIGSLLAVELLGAVSLALRALRRRRGCSAVVGRRLLHAAEQPVLVGGLAHLGDHGEITGRSREITGRSREVHEASRTWDGKTRGGASRNGRGSPGRRGRWEDTGAWWRSRTAAAALAAGGRRGAAPWQRCCRKASGRWRRRPPSWLYLAGPASGPVPRAIARLEAVLEACGARLVALAGAKPPCRRPPRRRCRWPPGPARRRCARRGRLRSRGDHGDHGEITEAITGAHLLARRGRLSTLWPRERRWWPRCTSVSTIELSLRNLPAVPPDCARPRAPSALNAAESSPWAGLTATIAPWREAKRLCTRWRVEGRPEPSIAVYRGDRTESASPATKDGRFNMPAPRCSRRAARVRGVTALRYPERPALLAVPCAGGEQAVLGGRRRRRRRRARGGATSSVRRGGGRRRRAPSAAWAPAGRPPRSRPLLAAAAARRRRRRALRQQRQRRPQPLHDVGRELATPSPSSGSEQVVPGEITGRSRAGHGNITERSLEVTGRSRAGRQGHAVVAQALLALVELVVGSLSIRQQQLRAPAKAREPLRAFWRNARSAAWQERPGPAAAGRGQPTLATWPASSSGDSLAASSTAWKAKIPQHTVCAAGVGASFHHWVPGLPSGCGAASSLQTQSAETVVASRPMQTAIHDRAGPPCPRSSQTPPASSEVAAALARPRLAHPLRLSRSSACRSSSCAPASRRTPRPWSWRATSSSSRLPCIARPRALTCGVHDAASGARQ